MVEFHYVLIVNFGKIKVKLIGNLISELLYIVKINNSTTCMIEALKKVIRYQESLEMGKGFNEKGLMMLRKQLRKWDYKKKEAKKQVSIMSFIKK